MSELDLSATLVAAITNAASGLARPLIVALDGRSGVGKSTLAAEVAEKLDDCVIVEGDEFYSGGTNEEWDLRSAEEKVARGIDWHRQRSVLEDLRRGESVRWFGFDWDAFDGRLATEATTTRPATVVILEGAYSARPELADLLDLRVLLDTPRVVRMQRLSERDGDTYRDDWFARWDEAEQFYFGSVMPPGAFDLVLVD